MWLTNTEGKAFVCFLHKKNITRSHTNDYRRLFYRDIEICPQKYTTVWDIVNKQKKNFFLQQCRVQNCQF